MDGRDEGELEFWEGTEGRVVWVGLGKGRWPGVTGQGW